MEAFKYRWHQLPISRQLLVLVNAILFGFVAQVKCSTAPIGLSS